MGARALSVASYTEDEGSVSPTPVTQLIGPYHLGFQVSTYYYMASGYQVYRYIPVSRRHSRDAL